MAKPLKIEQLGLQSIVAACMREGMNPQQIAEACTLEAKKPISNMAVRRYLEYTEGIIPGIPASDQAPPEKVALAVKADRERVQRLVDRDIDLIELQYKTTSTLAARFDWIAELPDLFEARMRRLSDSLREDGIDTAKLDHWGIGFTLELRRNIGNMAALNREIRANSQFMASLREKAFEFSLIQEYLALFMDIFRRVNMEAYEIAEAEIASNPRMQRIVEQQQSMRGMDEG
ncbi:hypothetical protein GXP70_12395 [Paenibacillus lycopersici]|uniref:Uncharacterized protein n=1 Tax=Paenibacillus lycopersici TaxID=2704462 RepID=A0A6C0G284_9BACL|nr:hypothetical protein [Paenibacillus lycopersici]QHT60660.1 hypothetical protein GXP70_12395 [Paenibacillus lycopersici]